MGFVTLNAAMGFQYLALFCREQVRLWVVYLKGEPPKIWGKLAAGLFKVDMRVGGFNTEHDVVL